jgi:hypothetical protein
MTGRSLVLVHSAPEVQEARARKRDEIHAGSPDSHTYTSRENTLRKEVGRLAIERLHVALASDELFRQMTPGEQLGFIRTALDRAYGNTGSPAKQEASEADGKINSKTHRSTLHEIGQALPELAKAQKAKDTVDA